MSGMARRRMVPCERAKHNIFDCSYHLTIPPRQDPFSLEEAGDRLGTAVLWRSWTMMIKSSWKDLSRATVRGAGVMVWFQTQTNSKLEEDRIQSLNLFTVAPTVNRKRGCQAEARLERIWRLLGAHTPG